MAGQKPSLGARLLKKFCISILSLACFVVAVFAFFSIKYDVNLIRVIKDVKQITIPVDEIKSFPDAICDDNLPNMRTVINASIPDYITADYQINESVYAYGLSEDLKLNNKNLGQFVNLLTQGTTTNTIELFGNQVQYQITQIGFYELNIENQEAVFSVTLKLDIRELKNSLNDFPKSILKKYITDDFYLTASVNVKKNNVYSYEVSGGELLLNSLSRQQCKEIFKAINIIAPMQGGVSTQAQSITNSVLDVLLDASKDNTLAKFLKNDFESPDYEFAIIDDESFLVYKK